MNYENRGQVMHLTLHDCTVVNRGTIINMDGSSNQIENRGTIINNNGARVIYKDRVEYRDRIVYRDREKVVYRDKTPKECEKELRQLRGTAKYLQQKCDELEAENKELTQAIEDTERQKLLREIDDLKEKLHKARQRENVAVQQRKDAEREARVLKSQIWDDFKPTKEACKQLYKNLKAFLDCED